jgi:hypothetical protein
MKKQNNYPCLNRILSGAWFFKVFSLLVCISPDKSGKDDQEIGGFINNPVRFAGADFPPRYSQYFLKVLRDNR